MTTKPPQDVFKPIPQIPVKPSIDTQGEDALVNRLLRLTPTYGPIFQLNLHDHQWVITANYELANDLCDEKRFIKKHLPFRLRPVLPTSIFLVSTTEPIWSKAHNIMLPLFSTQSLQAYMPKMWEATMTMIFKWEHLNPDDAIDVYDNMVRLTSDIIGSCCLDYNFQSFYRETPHPIISTMMRSLEGAALHDLGSSRGQKPEGEQEQPQLGMTRSGLRRGVNHTT